MISKLENQDGFITAFIEWDVLDFKGQFATNGDYICIREAWVHPSLRFSGAIGELSLRIYKEKCTQAARYVYWETFRIDGKKIMDLDKKDMAIHKNRKPILKEKILNKILKKGYCHE